MKNSTVDKVKSVGVGVNLAAGHVGEMAGRAAQAASKSVGCPVGQAVGRAVESAGKAWSDAAVSVGTRDADRLKR